LIDGLVTKFIALAFVAGMAVSCTVQTPDKPRSSQTSPPAMAQERFDFDEYSRRIAADPDMDSVSRQADGSVVEMLGGSEPVIRIHHGPPLFLETYKTFYADGALRERGAFIGQLLKVGKWQHYSEDGRLISETDEDKKFGTIKPAFIIDFLDREGWVNKRTGEKKSDFILMYKGDKSVLADASGGGIYYVQILNGAPNTDPPGPFGEPGTYKPLNYEIDGESGQVLKKYVE